METLTTSRAQLDLLGIIERFGPEVDEYSLINKIVNGIRGKAEEDLFCEFFKPVLNEHTLYGYTFLKPMGYAGDYNLIEMMYEKHVSPDPRYRKWDEYYHSHEATKAVRNRKVYFVNILNKMYAQASKPLNVLILGCGPASDVCDFFTANPNADVSFDLLDIDQRAIDYAQNKNAQSIDKLTFIKKNVLRFVPEKKYDLVWSAGLFDYLSDKQFLFLLKRFKNNLSKDGEMIIGNFSPSNPTRMVMEVMGQWFLNHRDVNHLLQIASEAGIRKCYMEVDKEPLGINLFLKIKASPEIFSNQFELIFEHDLQVSY